MIAGAGQQLLVGFGGAYGLNFATMLAMGEALGADLALLAEVLPAVEAARLTGLADDSGGDED